MPPLRHWLVLLAVSARLAARHVPALNLTTPFLEPGFLPPQDGSDACAPFQNGGMQGLNEFASPGYPAKYPSNVDCVRILIAPTTYDIVLNFKNVFQIEASYQDTVEQNSRTIASYCPNDYLEIRDGRYSFSPLIGQFCGMEAPVAEIRASSGFMWMHFHSDALLEYRGFQAEYTFAKGPLSAKTLFRPQDCFFTSAMTFDGIVDIAEIKDFYEKERNNTGPLDCVWQVQAPNWLSVAVFPEEFALATPNKCTENFVEIYAGLTAAVPLKRYCGITANHVYASQATVFIRFFAATPSAVLETRLRVLFSTYVPLKNCSEQNLFACGDDICIPQELVCSGQSNCLYARDEQRCGVDADVRSLVFSGYSVLLGVVFVTFVIVGGIVIWTRPCRPHEARMEAYLRELCTQPPPGLTHLKRDRPPTTRRGNSLVVSFPLSGDSTPSASSSITLGDLTHHAHCQNRVPPRITIGNGSIETGSLPSPPAMHYHSPSMDTVIEVAPMPLEHPLTQRHISLPSTAETSFIAVKRGKKRVSQSSATPEYPDISRLA